MRIVNQDDKFNLFWNYKIIKKKKKIIDKKGFNKEYLFFQSVFPEVLKDFMEIDNNLLYFYKDLISNKVYISNKKSKVQSYKKIKIQSSNQFSLPKEYLEINEKSNDVLLTLDLYKKDPVRDKLGLLTISII